MPRGYPPRSPAPAASTPPEDAADDRLHATIEAAQAGERLDRALAALWPQVSRSRLQALIRAGALSLDAATILDPSQRVKPGQAAMLILPRPVAAKPEAQDIPLDVIFEDASVIVLMKPAGLVVHPAAGNPDNTLVNALIAHCGDSLLGIGGERRPGIVHRLDKDTSGLMVAAKTEAAHRALVEQFSARSILRSYQALVWGLPAPAKGTITGSIGRSPRNRKKMAVTPGGRPAVTHYETREAFAGGGVSLLACRLETGRTHQIRVHLAEAGHSLVGDPLYGRGRAARTKGLSEAPATALRNFARQALHAERLGFRHPDSGELLDFRRPPPQDMAALIATLRQA